MKVPQIICVICVICGLPCFAAPKAYRFSNKVIVVDGDRIVDAKPAETIDLSHLNAFPGLIDVHTHMTYYWDQTPGTRPRGGGRLPAVSMFLAQENARKTLETGVTTVRDMNATEFTDVAMRDLIRMGKMLGPRMFVVGQGLAISRVSGVPEVLRAVRQQIAAGVDWIKMFGSTGSFEDVSGEQTFTFEEMKAAVDAAHAMGRRIAIHSYGPKGARDAVRAGADSVEHAVDLDDETLAEMVRRGTFYVPTVDHNRFYAEHAAEFGFASGSVERLQAFIERNLETVRRAHKAGVRMAMGSDAVYHMFGENTRELGWFIKAGMTPAQALATATTNAAALLGMEKSLGQLAPGFYADIIGVEGDPITGQVKWVMKAGVVVVAK